MAQYKILPAIVSALLSCSYISKNILKPTSVAQERGSQPFCQLLVTTANSTENKRKTNEWQQALIMAEPDIKKFPSNYL